MYVYDVLVCGIIKILVVNFVACLEGAAYES